MVTKETISKIVFAILFITIATFEFFHQYANVAKLGGLMQRLQKNIYKEGDTRDIVKSKLFNLNTLIEDHIIWKKTLVFSTFITFFIYIVYYYNPKFNILSYIIMLIFISGSLIWFIYHIFQHKDKLVKNAFDTLIDKI